MSNEGTASGETGNLLNQWLSEVGLSSLPGKRGSSEAQHQRWKVIEIWLVMTCHDETLLMKVVYESN